MESFINLKHLNYIRWTSIKITKILIGWQISNQMSISDQIKIIEWFFWNLKSSVEFKTSQHFKLNRTLKKSNMKVIVEVLICFSVLKVVSACVSLLKVNLGKLFQSGGRLGVAFRLNFESMTRARYWIQFYSRIVPEPAILLTDNLLLKRFVLF